MYFTFATLLSSYLYVSSSRFRLVEVWLLFLVRSCVPFSLIVRKMWQSWLIAPAASVSASRRHHRCCYPTRLETRTKESNVCASLWVVNSSAKRNRIVINTLVFHNGCFDSTDDDRSLEHVCWDPKDGELCLCRLKAGEILLEDRRDTDVQIVLQTWV